MSLEFRQGNSEDVRLVLQQADSRDPSYRCTAILDPQRLEMCDIFFVAFDGSEVVGFCGLQVATTPGPVFTSLYVLPAHRNQGVGFRLFLLGIDHLIARNKPAVYCEVTTMEMRRCVERLDAERTKHIEVEMNYTGEYEDWESCWEEVVRGNGSLTSLNGGSPDEGT